ncbi:response regulator [Deinococcus ruber]|uniref:Transcriptional regulatory protein n=1 Tax=Deinococcus ruber TaxID=1848197 RepID=A0A918BYG5_9DEIO|nr:response regulator [Deinococcus ruber]GGQ96995.1 transcriptional regulatory protein [Deinococcus ruber]
MMRVLLVEDDRWVARVNQGLLEQGGAEVVGVAGTVQEALRLVAQLQPDLLLLDVYLPDGTGVEVLLALRAAGHLLDVIMLTAADDLTTVRQALALGALDYIIKPFEQSRLQGALERVSSRRRLSGPALTQQRLDRFLGLPGAALPKGIEEGTLGRIRAMLDDEAQALSAEEVGARIGVSRVTAWRYLEYLLAQDVLELDFSYGLPGRPSKLYRRRRARGQSQED